MSEQAASSAEDSVQKITRTVSNQNMKLPTRQGLSDEPRDFTFHEK